MADDSLRWTALHWVKRSHLANMLCSRDMQQQGWIIGGSVNAWRVVSPLYDYVCACLLLYQHQRRSAGQLISDADGVVIDDNLFAHRLHATESGAGSGSLWC